MQEEEGWRKKEVVEGGRWKKGKHREEEMKVEEEHTESNGDK